MTSHAIRTFLLYFLRRRAAPTDLRHTRNVFRSTLPHPFTALPARIFREIRRPPPMSGIGGGGGRGGYGNRLSKLLWLMIFFFFYGCIGKCRGGPARELSGRG
ncbi:hypothetical protein PUN28_001554 [Cardiocondyla obscurior]|uniref:Uncharacterized protein n=1 Tax=Cardiocondyla obscurior TaxID=286306 RepID=A0AAW2H5L7_9HYME